MPRLIHINGPPAIGKSTIAARYADDHPGTLLLDVDRLRTFVGGWQRDFVGTGELVRPLALAMARIHLAGGKRRRDAPVPRKPDEIEALETAVIAGGAQFLEVVLMDHPDRSIQRFNERGSGTDDPLVHVIGGVVDQSGGESHLALLYQQLVEVLASRERAVRVLSEPGNAETTYRDVVAAIESSTFDSTVT